MNDEMKLTEEELESMADKLLEQANAIEEQVDDYTRRMEEGHVERMEKGICTPSVGAQYLELSSNAERIADHMINLAKTIRSLQPFRTSSLHPARAGV